MRLYITGIVCALFLAGGCGPSPSRTTYQRETLVQSVIDLCHKEYGFGARAWLIGETLIVYAPFPQLLDDKLQINPEITEKLNQVLRASSRVLLSTKNRPRFFHFIASDVETVGLDYTLTLTVADLVKFQLNVISRNEYLARNVTKVMNNPKALGDYDGDHIPKKDILMADFIAGQIANRIHQHSQLEDWRSVYLDKTFLIAIKPQSDVAIDDMLAIVAQTIHIYQFTDFMFVEASNVTTGEKRVVTRRALEGYLKKRGR